MTRIRRLVAIGFLSGTLAGCTDGVVKPVGLDMASEAWKRI
jgi:hypothetical protein